MARFRRAGYRVGQVILGLRPSLRPDEIACVQYVLSEGERMLFMAMEPRDRRHSMDMVHWLQARGQGSAELLVAALLHDVGKGRLRLWDRVAFVILGNSARGVRGWIRAHSNERFRDALWRLEHHAALGAAALAEQSSVRVRWLVARHTDTDPPEDEELRWLIAADSAC